MRKPETIERLYLDFDGFFAGVEQQADKRLRGRPVGVVPFEGMGGNWIFYWRMTGSAVSGKPRVPPSTR